MAIIYHVFAAVLITNILRCSASLHFDTNAITPMLSNIKYQQFVPTTILINPDNRWPSNDIIDHVPLQLKTKLTPKLRRNGYLNNETLNTTTIDYVPTNYKSISVKSKNKLHMRPKLLYTKSKNSTKNDGNKFITPTINTSRSENYEHRRAKKSFKLHPRPRYHVHRKKFPKSNHDANHNTTYEQKRVRRSGVISRITRNVNIQRRVKRAWERKSLSLQARREIRRKLLKKERAKETTPRGYRNKSWLPRVVTKNYDPHKVKQTPRLPNGRPRRKPTIQQRVRLAEHKLHRLPNDCGSFNAATNFHANILAAHNKFRRWHGVPEVKYSRYLSKVAGDWARKLGAMNSGLYHRPGIPYGENIWAVRDVMVDWRLKYKFSEKAVDHWYYEVGHFDWDDYQITSDNGHFTQLIWKEVEYVGCGYAADMECYKLFVVCNYSPIGNHYDKSIIKRNVLPLVRKS